MMSDTASTALPEQSPLALVCGGGTLPFAVAKALIRRRRIVLFPIHGWADPGGVAEYRHHWVKFGQFGLFCRTARAEGCRDVTFIGSVIRPSPWQLRPDLKTLRLLPRIMRCFRGGDDHLLSGIASIFEEHGFRVVGVRDLAPQILMPEGLLTRRRPSNRDYADIQKGLSLLKAISAFDVGQATVVHAERVLAVEGAEGTDRMLERIALLRRSGHIKAGNRQGVLVKAAKDGQDLRLDLPSIGPQTVDAAARAGLAGIAVGADKTVLADPCALQRAADAHGLFVLGVGSTMLPQ